MRCSVCEHPLVEHGPGGCNHVEIIQVEEPIEGRVTAESCECEINFVPVDVLNLDGFAGAA